MFCGCLPFAFAGFSATAARAEAPECTVYTHQMQAALSPDDAINLLKAGNERFIAGKSVNCDLMAQVKASASGQAPFAAIVSCIDSRVPPELVFDQRIGDIFSARIAGNFVNTDIIGSLEFAARVVGVRAIAVVGHSHCGAVVGAIDDVKLGNLTATLANIRPAVEATKFDGERVGTNPAFVQAVAVTNARLAAEMIAAKSPILKEMVEAGKLRIVWGMQDIADGRVTFEG